MDRGKIEQISKALADETRLMILEDVAARPEMTCGEIVSLRGVTPATVSHHLKVLHDAGLIECRKEGQFVRSRVLAKTLKAYAEEIEGIARRAGKSR
ncbi:MAG TPA: metalloregulator ArsR/SmtB family transcription factor [Candidatus Aquilonibacter sp.]|nr:metalloregulator ArsR/SmtB family transcription factor [Candidatus Aquilonibacter sp.]